MIWVLAIFSLIGVILNIKKNRICFIIWIGTNFAWAIVDFYEGIPAQGILFCIYGCLAVWGLLAWRKKEIKRKMK